MPGFKVHLPRGFIGSVGVTAAYGLVKSGLKFPPDVNPEEMSLFFVCALVGSLMIDLDTDSIPSRITALILSIYSFACVYHENYMPALLIAAAFIFIKSFPHRNYIHSWFLPLGIFIAGILTKQMEIVALSMGAVIHFMVDKIPVFKKSSWIKPFPWKIKIK